nr:GntR family transcriptional regulator [Vibrio sonorensis]
MQTESKYLQVEGHIKGAISDGIYQTDDKIPSIRQLCAELGVAKNTVIRAYQELEAQGFLYSVKKSGYRVSPVPAPEETPQKPQAVDMLSVAKEILTHDETKEWLPVGSAHPFTDVPAIRSLYAEIGRQARKQTYLPSQYELPPATEP